MFLGSTKTVWDMNCKLALITCTNQKEFHSPSISVTCKLGCLSCCARLHPRLLVYFNTDSSFELRQMLSTAGTQFLHLSECSCYVWLTIWFNCPDLTRTWCQNLCWFVASYCMDEVLFKAHTVKTKAVKCFRVKCREAVLAVDARKSEHQRSWIEYQTW